jgi:hypothetical protein
MEMRPKVKCPDQTDDGIVPLAKAFCTEDGASGKPLES